MESNHLTLKMIDVICKVVGSMFVNLNAWNTDIRVNQNGTKWNENRPIILYV